MLPAPGQVSRSVSSREITSDKGSVSEKWRRAEAVPRVSLGAWGEWHGPPFPTANGTGRLRG
jgi:hypothetical protein